MKTYALCLAAAAVLAATSARALTIVPTFDNSITSAANAAQIETGITNAVQFYGAFSDPVSVNILFHFGNTFQVGGVPALGESVGSYYFLDYPDYVTGISIQASLHPENTVLQTAVANLPFGNQLPEVLVTSAEVNTLLVPFGITLPGSVAGSFDGEILLDDAPGKLDFSGAPGPGQISATAVIQHEVDEILGVGGGGSALGRGFPDGFMVGMDAYRYNGPHRPSFTTDPAEQSYFSYDGGVTPIMPFDQNGIGDFGDWARTCATAPHVQDWAHCAGEPGVSLTRDSPEILALEAIGYNLAPVPEPASWALALTGFAAAGAALRRRRLAAA